MAPNVKQIAEVIATLDVSGLVETKTYLPLTHPDEEFRHVEQDNAARQQQKQQQQQQQQTEEVAVDAEQKQQAVVEEVEYVTAEQTGEASYWDWEAPAAADDVDAAEAESRAPSTEEKQRLIHDILAEEEHRQLFSVDHMVSNLVAESERLQQRQQESSVEYITRDQSEDEEIEGYWDMPAEHDLEEEPAAMALNTDQVVLNLIRDAEQRRQNEQKSLLTAPHVADVTHPRADYWDWPATPVTEEERRQKLIQEIMAEDEARQALSVDRIEENLRRAAAQGGTAANNETDDVVAKHDDNGYWTWTDQPPPTSSSAKKESNDQYWDWPSSTPVSGAELKRHLVQDILMEDQIRQWLSVEHFEENLKAEAQQQRHQTEEEAVQQQASHVEADADGYWDM